MPLNLCCSNRVEALHALLAQRLGAAPLSDPFQRELILIPSMAMKRWVNLQLGMCHGVAANIEYLLPAQWIWQLAAQQAPGQFPSEDPLSRERAAWRIHGLLPGLLSSRDFLPLRRYLTGDDTGVKRWQLAQRLADLFDRYQYYRPEWIRDWSVGRTTVGSADGVPAWQPQLWQALIADCKGRHRVALIDTLQRALSSGTACCALPERISCFALSSLPPLFVQVLEALSHQCEITLYQHSPTDQYWADLRSKKEYARKRLSNPEEAAYYDNGNELLASWGRQGQAFQDLLLSGDVLESSNWDYYPPAGKDSLLHAIQSDILNLNADPADRTPDDSVAVHVCHSPLRECQVLHDRILAAMDADATLKPEDILVMVPEISRYAPYVEAVFRFDETASRPFVPWNLSDTTLADEHPLIQTFLQLLLLPSSRFSFSELVSYLEVPRIARRFGLEGAALEEMLNLLQASGVRWGIDAGQKAEFALPPVAENTWTHGLDRLLAGYAMADVELWQGIAVMPGAQGADALALGKLCHFLETLRHWHNVLDRTREVDAWQQTINELMADFFAPLPDEGDKLQQIRDAMKELKQYAPGQEISLSLLGYYLQEHLNTRTQHGRYFSGGVTICGMRPMRSLPFRMICVLGMSDAAFPRREQSQAFDAMAGHWRPGDPRKPDEDRYLMLETLLCARERLYFSYTGRSLKDNSELQPSVLLREFMDFLDAHYALPEDGQKEDGQKEDEKPESKEKQPMSACLRVEHPMQAFHWQQFDAAGKGATLASYDDWWCEIADTLLKRTIHSAPGAGESWPVEALAGEEEDADQVDLGRLLRFLQHPVKGFFNARLGIYLREEEADENEEAFTLDGREVWAIHQELIGRALAGQEQSERELQALFSARGQLPHGALADASFQSLNKGVQEMLERLQAYQGSNVRPLAVQIACPLPAQRVVLLNAQVSRYRPGKGLLHFAAARMKPKHRLELWLEHLALCAAGMLAQEEDSVLICRDGSVRFLPLAQEEAVPLLAGYLELYFEGLTRPLPLFPGVSYELALGPDEAALRRAQNLWFGSEFSPVTPECQDTYIAMMLRGLSGSPLENEEHLALARRVYEPMRLREEVW